MQRHCRRWARRLGEALPRATIVSLGQADTPADSPQGLSGLRLPTRPMGPTERVVRVAQAVAALQIAVRDRQERSGVSAAATALIGVSQGAEVVLEASKLSRCWPAAWYSPWAGRFTHPARCATGCHHDPFLDGKLDALVPYSDSVTAAHDCATWAATSRPRSCPL